jgi:3-oxoadipate enol-lactonase
MAPMKTRVAKLYVEEAGDRSKPAVVFHHALGASSRMWRAQIEALSQTHYVLAYDARSHGQSEEIDAPARIEDLVEDALDVLNVYNFKSVSWVGLSMGGMVGMALAALYPERVDRLVAANTSALMGPAEIWEQRIALVQTEGLQTVADLMRERWFLPQSLEGQAGDVEAILKVVAETKPRGYIRACEAIRDMDLRETIRAIKAPTLVIVGDEDPSTPPAMGEDIAHRIEGAQLATIPARHLSNIDAPEVFNALLSKFLSA